jgi:hypothetical protein
VENFRQLRHVGRNPPRLVADEQPNCAQGWDFRKLQEREWDQQETYEIKLS